MAQQHAGPVRPERILLATDLSHRCDRALDRAVELARRWDGDLVIVHALERPSDLGAEQQSKDMPFWLAPQDRPLKVERRLRRDLPIHDVRTTIVVKEGRPAALVMETAGQRQTDLIVTGVARDNSFEKLLLGGTVDALLRDARNPLLVVRDRAHQPYRQVIVPVDFTESSRYALQSAALLFPEAALTVFHGTDAPYAGLMDSTRYLDDMREGATADCHTFLDRAGLPDDIRARTGIVVEVGAPDQLLASYIERSDVDLVVLAAHGRGRLYDVIIGSTARAILNTAPCDVLLLRAPAAAAG